MNPQRTNLLFIILLATAGNFLFLLLNISVDTWFTSPNQKSDYIAFYIVLCLVAFAFGSLYVVDSPKHRYWKIGISLLLVSNLLAIAFGSVFTFVERTEEFILYFLGIQLTWLLYLSVLGNYMRYLFSSKLLEKQKNRIIIIGMIWLFVAQTIRAIAFRVTGLEIIHFLIVTTLCVAIILLFSFRVEDSTSQEEDSQPVLKKSGLRTVRIVTMALAILVSIFFIVYANIQTQLAKEQEWMSNKLRTEAVQLQEAAQREVERVLTENAELEQQLEECQGVN